jgi:hypothetical protein
LLGDLIYEAKGKIAGYRVLDVEGPKIEVTIIQNGTLKGGIKATNIVHIGVYLDPGGAYYAEGKECSWQKVIPAKRQHGLDRESHIIQGKREEM